MALFPFSDSPAPLPHYRQWYSAHQSKGSVILRPTDSLTNSLVDLTNVTLAFEDANFLMLLVLLMLMLRNVLVGILKLKLGRDLEPRFWSRYRSKSLVKTLKLTFCSRLWSLRFRQGFEGEVWSRFWKWKFAKMLTVKIGWYWKAEICFIFWGCS